MDKTSPHRISPLGWLLMGALALIWGGSFVAKAFQGGETAEVIGWLKRDYEEVRTVKPKASRSDSSEIYLVARGFRGDRG